ncbi:MAG: hypothetical protein V7670_06510 [Maribacter arcticus]|uniref:hypothetical protein n=1 Tax=Maribacter arcticus TaxID=561365 RepID=UPI003001EA3C
MIKKLYALLVFVFTYSIGYAQDDSNESTMENTVEQKEMKQVKRKVEKSEAKAEKEKKQAKDLKKQEKLEKQVNSKSKAISKQENQIEKLQSQLEKGKLKGTLSPVDIQKMDDKIVNIQMKVMKEQEKLKKLKRKM